jgi:hypothetical protein
VGKTYNGTSMEDHVMRLMVSLLLGCLILSLGVPASAQAQDDQDYTGHLLYDFVHAFDTQDGFERFVLRNGFNGQADPGSTEVVTTFEMAALAAEFETISEAREAFENLQTPSIVVGIRGYGVTGFLNAIYDNNLPLEDFRVQVPAIADDAVGYQFTYEEPPSSEVPYYYSHLLVRDGRFIFILGGTGTNALNSVMDIHELAEKMVEYEKGGDVSLNEDGIHSGGLWDLLPRVEDFPERFIVEWDWSHSAER